MTKYALTTIANGPAGIRQTLRIMSKITKKYKSSQPVRELALSIVRGCGEKKWFEEAECLLDFVQRKIRYVKDIRGVETLHTPPHVLRLGQGDCDDKSLLLASLLESIGHPTRFVAVGAKKGRFSHVLVQTKIAGRWVWAETTEPWPLGRGPKFKSMMVEHN